MRRLTDIDLTSNVIKALGAIATKIENSIGFTAALLFYNGGAINEWEYKFLLGTDEPSWELSKRQLACRRKINTIILHSVDEFVLYAIGIDVDEASIAKNGWRWDSRLTGKHVVPEKGLSPFDS
jgi:hypothetical protein